MFTPKQHAIFQSDAYYKSLIWKQIHVYQRPQDIDGEEGDGEGYEAHSLQPAAQLKMVLSAPQAQPAWNGCQGRDKQEAHHVAEQRPLLITRAGVPQPLRKRKMGDSNIEEGEDKQREAKER